MQHAKFQDHRTSSFKEEDFLRFLPYMGILVIYGHLGHVTWTIYTNFRSPFPRRLHIKFGLVCQVVSEEKTFENGGQRRQ